MLVVYYRTNTTFIKVKMMNINLMFTGMITMTMCLCLPSFCNSQEVQESENATAAIPSENSASNSLMELIDRTKDWPSKSPNPVALIRASNTLRKLPKSEILAALSEYIEKHAPPPSPYQNPYHLHALVESLFDPADPSQRLEYPSSVVTDNHSQENSNFPWNPRVLLKFSDDIPWALVPDYWAVAPLSEADIQWLKRYAVVRTAPLRPADNPLIAAENLIRSVSAAREAVVASHSDLPRDGYAIYLRENVAKQSISMVSNWIPAIPELPYDDYMWAPFWEPILNKSKTLGIYWDETKQEYAIGRKVDP